MYTNSRGHASHVNYGPWSGVEAIFQPYRHKNNHISRSIQRQKLSIAASEPACQDPSHERLHQTVLFAKRQPKPKKHRRARAMKESWSPKCPNPESHIYT